MAKRKKKQSNNVLYIFLVLFILSVVGFAVLRNTTIGQKNPGINIIARPVFGKLECAPDSPPLRSTTIGDISKDGSVLPSSFFGDVSSVQISVFLPSKSVIGNYRRLRYSICSEQTDASGCRIFNNIISQSNTASQQTETLPTINNQEIYIINYEEDQGGIFATKWVSIAGARFTASYTPYVLYRDTIFQPKKKIAPTCYHPEYETSTERLELLTQSSIEGHKARSGYVTKLEPEEFWTFIEGFALSPVEVETYKGQQAYCSNNIMYGFDEIETSIGNTYLIPDTSKSLGSVECCNGDVELNRVCENHKWVDLQGDDGQEPECSLINPCPLSDWVVNPEDPTRTSQIKQSCQSGRCVLQERDVECATSTACGEGHVCNEDFECEQVGGTGDGEVPFSCGNNVCEEGEDSTNCPIDCPRAKKKCDFFCTLGRNIMIISILSSILTSFALFFTLYNQVPKKKRDAVNMIAFSVISILAGGLVYYVLNTLTTFIFSFWGIIITAIVLVVVTAVILGFKRIGLI